MGPPTQEVFAEVVLGCWFLDLALWGEKSVADIAAGSATRRTIPRECRDAWATILTQLIQSRAKALHENDITYANRLEKLLLALPRLLLPADIDDLKGGGKLAVAARRSAAIRKRFVAFGRADWYTLWSSAFGGQFFNEDVCTQGTATRRRR